MLQPIYFESLEDCSTLEEADRVTTIKLGVNNGGGDSTGCLEIKVRSVTSEVYTYRNNKIQTFRLSGHKN